MRNKITAVCSITTYEAYASEIYQTLCLTKPIANGVELATRIGIECVPYSKDSQKAKILKSYNQNYFYDEEKRIIYFDDDMLTSHQMNVDMLIEILVDYIYKLKRKRMRKHIAHYLSLYMLCPIQLINKLGLDKKTLINVFGFDEENAGALLQHKRVDTQTYDQQMLECLKDYINHYNLTWLYAIKKGRIASALWDTVTYPVASLL